MARAAVARLQALGVRTVMLTGDNAGAARQVAQALGIDEVHAQVLPEDKGKIVTRLRTEGHIVAMAGDGGTELLPATLISRLNAGQVWLICAPLLGFCLLRSQMTAARVVTALCLIRLFTRRLHPPTWA